jgi:hypothetical protein
MFGARIEKLNNKVMVVFVSKYQITRKLAA